MCVWMRGRGGGQGEDEADVMELEALRITNWHMHI